MDPTANINALRQYMDLYRQSHRRTPTYNAPGGSGFNPTSFDDDAMALNWAQQQMASDPGNAPDFFGGEGPQYVRPKLAQDIAGEAGFPLAPQDRAPMQRRPDGGAADMAMNYLRNLFRR